MSVPYTYLIGWSTKNKFYYGVRYAKGCLPEDLWNPYKTSSKVVNSFYKKYGDPDIIQIRRIFSSVNKARLWEHKVLKRIKADTNDKFLNLSCNQSPGLHDRYHRKGKGVPKGTIPYCKGKFACYNPKTNKLKYVSSMLEIPEGWLKGGPKKTKEHNLKNSLANTGKRHTDKTKKLLSINNGRASKNKKWFHKINGEEKYFFENQVPEGWIRGRYKPNLYNINSGKKYGRR